ncbi:hypothetical protein T01_15369 [Trichinella spiralis]|uniref:Uncharacterized protein n=1 Tax=Trichinella spiralis TaxID=6334 RepID=A0A0V1B382_TRISP|nr:hypothetical protein T01_15369 [Trichinella spiralis]
MIRHTFVKSLLLLETLNEPSTVKNHRKLSIRQQFDFGFFYAPIHMFKGLCKFKPIKRYCTCLTYLNSQKSCQFDGKASLIKTRKYELFFTIIWIEQMRLNLTNADFHFVLQTFKLGNLLGQLFSILIRFLDVSF